MIGEEGCTSVLVLVECCLSINNSYVDVVMLGRRG